MRVIVQFDLTVPLKPMAGHGSGRVWLASVRTDRTELCSFCVEGANRNEALAAAEKQIRDAILMGVG